MGKRDKKVSSDTHITYCTPAYLVQLLCHNPDALHRITHVVLDEAHERSTDLDLLLLRLKLTLVLQPGLRLIVMSATLQRNLLSGFFADMQARPPPRPEFC